MTYQTAATPAPGGDAPDSLPHLPGWATSGRAETAEAVAFRSGAALFVLDRLVSGPDLGVPVRLLGNRLAMNAAVATSRLEGRMAREADLRDALHLTPPGAARGPDGDLLAFWREAARLRIRGRGGQAGIAGLAGAALAPEVEGWLRDGAARARTEGPLAACALVLRAVLQADDRAERVACLLSDIVLARALDWAIPLPLTAPRLTRAPLRGPEVAVEARLLHSVEDAIGLARDLARRAAALRAVAPKLRAKGAAAAVELFLTEDAVAPSGMLSPVIRGTSLPMTGRAARRLCDRLVDLGVARELTGRATFRLYGI